MPLDRAKLRSFLETEMGLEPDEFGNATPLFSGGVLDSFSMVDLIQFIEAETGARMRPGDVSLDNLDSVDRIVAWADAAGGSSG